MLFCPFCEKNFNKLFGRHIYICDFRPNYLSDSEVKFIYLKEKYGEICDYDNFYKNYIVEKKSLPDFKKEYDINYQSTQFLISYHGLKARGIDEANKLCAPKREKTCLEKYGVKNPSQVEEVKEKKRQTFLEHYGVDNIRKYKPFYEEMLPEIIMEKYGKSKREFLSDRAKAVWQNKTEDEKDEWLKKSILKNGRKRPNKFGKLENRIAKALTELNIDFERQFRVDRLFFDFNVGNYILIEVNGTYWHCDPREYKPGDVVSFPVGEVLVDDVWERDKNKERLANYYGYKVLYIWEQDVDKLDDCAVKLFIEDALKR